MACDYCYVCIVLFFFFKQKTAYELRISDWSSDVCSSDDAVQRFADDRIGRGSYHRGEMRRLDFGGVAGADVQPHVNGPAQLSFCVEQGRRVSGEPDAAPVRALGNGLYSRDRPLRPDERRVGEEWLRTGRSRWAPD